MAAASPWFDTLEPPNQFAAYTADELYALGEIALQAEDYPRAEEVARHLMEMDIGNANAHLLLAMVACQNGHFEIARECLQTAISLDQSNACHYCNMAVTLYFLGEHENAHTAVRTVLALPVVENEHYGMAYFRLGALLLHMDALEFAQPVLERAVQVLPESPECFARLALVYCRLDQPDKALAAANTSAQLMPIDRDSIRALRDAFVQLSELQAARHWTQKLIDLEPDNADLYIDLASQYDMSGMYQRAEKTIKRARLLNPDCPDTAYTFACILTRQAREDEACSVVEDALQKEPQHELLITLKASILEHRGEIESAYSCLLPLIEKGGDLKSQTLEVYNNILRHLESKDKAAQI